MDQAPALHEWPWLKTSSKNLSGYPSPSRDWVTDSDTPQVTPLVTSISILPYEPCYSRGMFTKVNTPALKADSYPHITNGGEKQGERPQAAFAKRASLSRWFARKAGPSWERAR